jgi:hypothetical protein
VSARSSLRRRCGTAERGGALRTSEPVATEPVFDISDNAHPAGINKFFQSFELSVSPNDVAQLDRPGNGVAWTFG